MELRQLRYFVVVAEELHFGRAAERLHIVQPAVSQQIRRLERELGVTLFDRSSRRVALTAAGRELLTDARATLDAAGRVRDRARQLAPTEGRTVRLGTSEGLGPRLTGLLAALAAVDPPIATELVRLPRPARLDAVVARTLDAAVVHGPVGDAPLRLERLWEDELVAALPAAATEEDGPITLAELVDLPILLPERAANPPLVDAITHACREAGRVPTVVPASNDQDMLARISTGRPPVWTVFFALRADQLRPSWPTVAFRPITSPGISLPAHLVLPAGPPRPLQEALLAVAASVARTAAS